MNSKELNQAMTYFNDGCIVHNMNNFAEMHKLFPHASTDEICTQLENAAIINLTNRVKKDVIQR